MADDIASLVIEIDSKGVVKASGNLNKLQKESGKAEKSTDQLTESNNKLKSSLAKIVAVAAAVTVSFLKMVKVHREFTSAISELSAITGATGSDLKFYKEQAGLMGSVTTKSATEIVQAFKLIASAKPDLLANKEALAAVTREVVTLSEAAGLDMVIAAEAVGVSLNQFSAGAEEAARFVNVLAAGAKFGASEIDQTSEALKKVGVVAANTGLSFEQTNAAIQLIAKGGIKGSEAATGLRGALLKLSTQSNDEFNPAIVGIDKALQNLAAANLTATDKTKLFGLESITVAELLIKEAGAIGGLTKQLTGTNVAYDQASTRTNNLSGDIERMGNEWERTGRIIGDMFDPALRGITELAGYAGKVISSMSLAFRDAGDGIGAFVAQLTTFSAKGRQAIRELREEQKAASEAELASIWGGGDQPTKPSPGAQSAASGQIQIEELQKENEDKLQAEADYQASLIQGWALTNMALEEQRQSAFDAEWEKIIEMADLKDQQRAAEQNAEAAHSKIILAQKTALQDGAIALLRAVPAKSKGAMNAIFLLEKAFEMSRAWTAGLVAAEASAAHAAIVGGPIAANAAYAASLGRTKLTLGMMAATSALQLGGGGGGGSAAAPAPSQAVESATTGVTEAADAGTSKDLNITLVGEGLKSDADIRLLLERINEVQKDMGTVNLVVQN